MRLIPLLMLAGCCVQQDQTKFTVKKYILASDYTLNNLPAKVVVTGTYCKNNHCASKTLSQKFYLTSNYSSYSSPQWQAQIKAVKSRIIELLSS